MSANAAAFNSKVVPCHAGSQTASSNGKSIDTWGYETLTFIYQFGTTTTGTSGTVTLKLQESSDDGSTDTFADITGATTAALTTDTGGQNAKRHAIVLNLKGRERYIRAVLTVANTVNTAATGPLHNAGVLIASNGAVTLPSTHFDSLTQVVAV